MVAKVSKFGKRRSRAFENAAAATAFLVVLVVIIGFFAYQNISIGKKRMALESELRVLQAQVAELEAQGVELGEELENTQTEEYQEWALRELGLYKKPGEEVVTILAPEEEGGVGAPSQKEKNSVWWNPFSW